VLEAMKTAAQASKNLRKALSSGDAQGRLGNAGSCYPQFGGAPGKQMLIFDLGNSGL
jgi:hypothetical protein